MDSASGNFTFDTESGLWFYDDVISFNDSYNMGRVFSGSAQNRRSISLSRPLNKDGSFLPDLVFGPNGWQKRPKTYRAIPNRDPRKQWTNAPTEHPLARSRKGVCR